MAYHNQASRDVDQDGRTGVAEDLAFPQGSNTQAFFRCYTSPPYYNQAVRNLDQDGRTSVAEGLAFPQGSNMPASFHGYNSEEDYNEAMRTLDQIMSQGSNSPCTYSSSRYLSSIISSSIYLPKYSIDEVVTDDELIGIASLEGDFSRVMELAVLRDDSILPKIDEVVTDDEYFTRADLDEDGRICIAEGLAFFQGSNLPKYTIDEIWRIADDKQEGFLGREEFKNALKLVSLVQQRLEREEDVFLSVEKETLLLGRVNNIPAPRIKIVTPDQHLKWLKIWATAPAVKAGDRTYLWHKSKRIHVFPNGDMRYPVKLKYHSEFSNWVLQHSATTPPPPPAEDS